MKAFIGIVLNMGVIRLTRIKDYWSTLQTCNVPFFRQVMSRNRFSQIFNVLHIGEIETTSKMDKVQEFIDLILEISQPLYALEKEIALDESIVPFTGRTSFKQYVKNKPNPWGLKVYALSGSKSGYMHNILVYAGKQTPLLPLPTHSHTTKVVLTLVDYLRDKGHDLYTDRFYTSVELADELTKMGFSITGTIQKNRKFLPTKIKKLSKMSKGSVITFRKKEKMLLAWMDERIVFMLSTKYSNNMVDIQTRLVVLLMFVYVVITFYSRGKSRVVKKPEVVAEYNQFMLGVDKIDQMMSYYSFVRKSIKWWRKVFFWLLDMSVVNSFIIYRHTLSDGNQSKTQVREAHLDFRRSIINELVKPLVTTTTPPPLITDSLQWLNGRTLFLKK